MVYREALICMTEKKSKVFKSRYPYDPDKS